MPAFGRSFLAHWWLDPDITYLNHGTVGATPRVVLETQHAWQRRIEAQPASLLFRELMRVTPDEPGAPRPLLRATAEIPSRRSKRAPSAKSTWNVTSLRSLRCSRADTGTTPCAAVLAGGVARVGHRWMSRKPAPINGRLRIGSSFVAVVRPVAGQRFRS